MIDNFGFFPLPVVNTKVTMYLNELLKTYTGNVSNPTETYADIIWNFSCPWYYTGAAQTAFQQKVIDHFRFRQIGFETPGRFIFEFQQKFKEIMPYYIQMYHSVDLMNAVSDPLENYNMIEEKTGSATGSSTGSATNTGTTSSTTTDSGTNTETANESQINDVRLHRHLDTPQGRVQNLTDGYVSYADKDDSTTDTHSATKAGSVNNTTTGSGENEQTGESEYNAENEYSETLTRHGNIGVTTYAQMLKGYRETFVNVDMMIMDELDEVFLQTF